MLERYFNTRSQSGSALLDDTAPPVLSDKEKQVEMCRNLTSRISKDMTDMRNSTEEAALCIGELLDQIVKTATDGNTQLQSTLSEYLDSSDSSDSSMENKESLHRTIERQSRVITSLVQRMQEFFRRQEAMTKMANATTEKVFKTSKMLESRMSASKLLALNLKIESARMGLSGNTFGTLSEQVRQFSDEVCEANRKITDSISEFTSQIPQMSAEAEQIGTSVEQFYQQFESEMRDIQDRVDEMSSRLKQSVQESSSINNKILTHSQATLSYLQFQDPVSQGLMRAQHDINKLRELYETGEFDDVSLADIDDAVGNDGRSETAAGDVLLF